MIDSLETTPSTTPPAGSVRSAADSLTMVYLATARCCGVHLRTDMVGVAMPVDDGEMLRSLVVPTVGSPLATADQARLIPAADTIGGYTLATGNATISPDLESDARFHDHFLRALGLRSALVLPVWLNDQPVCLLGLFRRRAQDFMLNEVWYVERVVEALSQLADAAGSLPETELPAVDELPDRLSDAELNEHRLAAMLDKGTGPECRVSPRRDYPYRQKIAPLHGDRMPGLEEFVEVDCGDLSGGGISLWLPSQPRFRDLIVALGRPPLVAHFTARIVYVRQVSRGGRPMYQVGCQFLHRVYL